MEKYIELECDKSGFVCSYKREPKYVIEINSSKDFAFLEESLKLHIGLQRELQEARHIEELSKCSDEQIISVAFRKLFESMKS